MLVYFMVGILTHFWLTFVPKWGILKLLGEYRYLSIMKHKIIDNYQYQTANTRPPLKSQSEILAKKTLHSKF
jgi:hypothetical protein